MKKTLCSYIINKNKSKKLSDRAYRLHTHHDSRYINHRHIVLSVSVYKKRFPMCIYNDRETEELIDIAIKQNGFFNALDDYVIKYY